MAEIWTDVFEDRLVALWQERECLYDVESKGYSNRVTKAKAIGEIAKVLEIEEKEILRKMATLRTQFSRYCKPAPSGSAASKKTARQVWVTQNLGFLAPFMKKRPSVSNFDTTEQDIDEDPYTDENIDPKLHVAVQKNVSDVEVCAEIEVADNVKSTKQPLSTSKKSKIRDDRDREELGVLKSISEMFKEEQLQEPSPKDDISVFAEHVERQLRQIPDPRTLLLLQNQIEQAIFQARLDAMTPAVQNQPQQHIWHDHFNSYTQL